MPTACGTVSPARARAVIRGLARIRTQLAPLAEGNRSSITSAKLATMLRHVRDAAALAECIGEPIKRRTATHTLDEWHTKILRAHSRLRKSPLVRSASDPGGQAPPSVITLLPLGDSITDGGAKQRSYRYHLHRRIERARYRVRWVGSMRGVHDKQLGRNATSGALVHDANDWPTTVQRHEGHWGWTSWQVLRGHERQPQRGALAGWLQSLTHSEELPDVALLHLGTNDLTKRQARQRADSVEPVGAIARRVSTIVQRLCSASPSVRIVVAAPIPFCRFRKAHSTAERSEQMAARRKSEAEYARLLYGICEQWSSLSCSSTARIACVNMSAVVGCEHLGADGVHPALGGAERMAALWFRALAPWLHALAGV